jgi:hypothetical protein
MNISGILALSVNPFNTVCLAGFTGAVIHRSDASSNSIKWSVVIEDMRMTGLCQSPIVS